MNGFIILLIVSIFSNVVSVKSTDGPLVIVSLRDQRTGGIMKDVDTIFSMGFNHVLVPIQKTRDEKPRFLVTHDTKVSKLTMMQFHQNQTEDSQYIPMLSEFMANTNDMLENLWIPIESPEDVDVIVHQFSLVGRKSESFVMMIPQVLVNVSIDKMDAISRYNSLVSNGKIVMIVERVIDVNDIVRKSIDNGIKYVVIPSEQIDKKLLDLFHANHISVGSLEVNGKKDIQRIKDINIDFLITKEPIHYLSLVSPKIGKHRSRTHLAILLS